jgi:hypothetical protein
MVSCTKGVKDEEGAAAAMASSFFSNAGIPSAGAAAIASLN